MQVKEGFPCCQYRWNVGPEALLLPNWDDDDWKQLFRFTSTRRVPAGEALIRGGEPGGTLYFVLHGQLFDRRVRDSGTIQCEQGPCWESKHSSTPGPRSAGAWAVDDCEVAAMSPDQYAAFEESSSARARNLLFALGRILALRLRRTTAKVVG